MIRNEKRWISLSMSRVRLESATGAVDVASGSRISQRIGWLQFDHKQTECQGPSLSSAALNG